MKILQVVPKRGAKTKLKTLLNEKERELRGGRTTFVRQRAGRWRHKTYYGWVKWEEAGGGVIVAEIRSKVPQTEWQLVQAFVGYLDRHLGRSIETITITYR